MIWLSFLWFLLLYSGTFYFSKNKDIFGPLRFVSIKSALFNLPFILYTAIYPNSFLQRILSVCQTDVYTAFFKYTLLQTLAFASMVVGVLIVGASKQESAETESSLSKRRLLRYTVVATIVPILAYMVFLGRIGGLSVLLNHLYNRVILQQGHYVLELLIIFPLSVLLLFLMKRTTGKKIYGWLIPVALLLFSALLTTFGARQPTMIVIGMSLVGYHYYWKTITVNRKTILISSFVLLFMGGYLLVVPFLRLSPEKQEQVEHNNNSLFTGKSLVYNLSYVYIDVLVANYFNKDNAWFMEGYFAPVKAFNYKGDKGDIPQVDQGVYLKSIFLGQKDYRPPMPRREVSKTSWPTENFGFAYANFLWIGLIVFFFLQGLIFGIAYRFTMKHLFNPVVLLFYILIILKFNFSSLRVAFFLKTFPIICLCWFVFDKFVVVKNQRQQS